MRKMFQLAVILQAFVIFGHAPLAKEKPLLESIEWSDTWVENADRQDLPRVLLAGDSIVQGYFGVVKERLTGEASCARYSTSKYIGDPDYLVELELLLKRYRFKVIHINNGLHGWEYTEKQ